MNPQAQGIPFVLGLDLGAESIGWAILTTDKKNITGIAAAGSHTFEAGVTGDIPSGKDESKAKARRDARQPRRQHWRRAWRRQKLLRILQRHGLFPLGPIDTPESVHQAINDLDATLHAKDGSNRIISHLLPYRLRVKALDETLEPHELGRALYHLAQRRGFLSNRKTAKADEDEGVVKAGISELQGKINETGARTLGEYFALLDPEEHRIRQRWTGRSMYITEFEAIWSKQAELNPTLTKKVKKEIYDAIFDQRPLKSQSHLIGECELVPGHKRAPLASRIAQRFRLLQKVNDLRIFSPTGLDRSLTAEERTKLIATLSRQNNATFAGIRAKKCLGLPKGTTFNFEEGGEKNIPGNRTDAALRGIFGDCWDSFSETERDQIVDEILSFEDPEALARRGKTGWGLDNDAAEKLADATFEPGHSMHSRKALKALVEAMENGTQYSTARKTLFPESFEATDPIESLPPVMDAVKNLRNPAVCRALTELRKLVNEIIRVYGKPSQIRIELATDLKRTRKQRKEVHARNATNRKLRDAAKARILDEIGDTQPSRADVEKVLLAEECNWICPYTGKTINMQSILGQNPQFDIEHIWPMSQSLDNTYINKTLCYHEENRTTKGNRTPFAAYSGDEEKWHEILSRVRRFQGEAARSKLRRFLTEEIPEGFTDRQLQDTRYASRLGADYLGLLYGGRVDQEGKQRIQVCAGGVTFHLRNEWQLNGILNDGGTKSRDDHRHHAVDAIAIGLSDATIVKKLADAASRAHGNGGKLFLGVRQPWPGFLDDVRKAIDAIKVSKRANRGLSGPLHEESFYSKPQKTTDGKGRFIEYRHIRKPLVKMSAGEVNAIVDPIIRNLVKAKLAESGKTPEKTFVSPDSFPKLVSRDGRTVSIRKARIRKKLKTIPVGEGATLRYVAPGSNHHMAIVATLGKDGQDAKWDGVIVSRFEAVQRARRKEMVVQRTWPDGKLFRFSLAPGEMFSLDDEELKGLFVVRCISGNNVEFARSNDARLKKEVKASHDWFKRSANALRTLGCKKVTVSYLGEIHRAND